MDNMIALGILFTNKVFLAALLANIVAQAIKIHLMVIKKKQSVHLKDIFLTGGMPSSHSSLVASLSLMIFLTEGFSTIFFVTFFFSAIVIRDAMGIRRATGEEGMMINRIIKATKLKLPEKHYAMGHTPEEVIIGIIIGFLSALLVYFL
jgi:acid phosphatase family membrane protein YuiD